MRLLRSKSALLLLVTAGLGLANAGPAAADVVNAGTLAKDTATTATVTVAGRDLQYGFAGVKDLPSTIDVNASAWGSGTAQLEIFTPANVLYTVCGLAGTPTFCEFTPNVTGTWKLRVDPVGTATGSTTIVYAQEQNKGTLTSGRASTTTVGRRGQNAKWAFAATNGLPTTFNVTASSWGAGGAARLYFFAPGATKLFSWCDITQPTQCTIYPNATGTWRVQIDPLEASVGSTTFVYAQDQDKGALTPGTPVSTSVTIPYQDVRYTFPATANTHLSLDVTATNWGTTGTAKLNVFMPDGTLYVQCPLAKAATFCDFTPNTTGTWKLTLDPQSTAVGSTTMNLVADQSKGALTVGTTITTTIAAKGQNALFTLPGTPGTAATLHVTGTNFGAGGAARLYLFAPTGSTLYDFCDLEPGTTDCTFYPSTTGTWRVTLDPLEAAVGTTTIKRTT